MLLMDVGVVYQENVDYRSWNCFGRAVASEVRFVLEGQLHSSLEPDAVLTVHRYDVKHSVSVDIK